ncbi:YnbE family lipoprotein [Ferruginivarius sediminum]|uniref:YnbE family lipoprotein n=1 Tax=Ferruginivarius sediminum TaxID=2661937 RepID=A0A369TEW8_9PROT|nr:YnbE family lipoprotein [Ferruginivarius sediminum]RDD63863.1 YnbE family lipoprotein [Ferruginivarius sediminum]
MRFDQEVTVRLQIRFPAAAVLVLGVVACQPTVKVEAPDKPITINLNVKLDAEVRVKLEKQAEEDIQQNPDIF